MKDKFGTEFIAGNYVVVARRRSSSSWLDKCIVVRVDDVKGPVLKTVRPDGSHGDRTYYYRGSNDAIMVVS